MKTIAAFALGLGVLGFLGLPLQGEDKKESKPEEKKAEKADSDTSKLEGKYALVGGKKNGTAIDEDAKKAKFSITADTITIEGLGVKFVMGYKADTKASPMTIDLVILEGPEGTKGAKAIGIFEFKDEVLKLAYSLDKEKRPKDFDGKAGFLFELKKAK
ncbi:MAG: TIGR03067 domain-containing protein [Gemmataceae bacterium]